MFQTESIRNKPYQLPSNIFQQKIIATVSYIKYFFYFFVKGICFLLVCRVQKFVRKLQSRKRVDNVDFEIYHIETFSNDKRKTKTFKHSKTSNDLAFLSQFDLEVLNFLQHFSNKPIELLKIGTPALITIILGPFAILFYHSTTEFFLAKGIFSGTSQQQSMHIVLFNSRGTCVCDILWIRIFFCAWKTKRNPVQSNGRD